MHKQHQIFLEEIKRIAKKNPKQSGHFDVAKYMGTKHFIYGLKSSQAREIAKKWARENKNISVRDFESFFNSLYQGESHDERTFGGKLLEYLPRLQKQINPSRIDKWLTGAQGWWEVDSLCQMCFGGNEMIERWGKWENIIKKLAKDKDVHKRRASLVLLTKPVRESDDTRLSNLAFENIDLLKQEKDILITKAVSWLLRSLIKYHREEVENYLNANGELLPKIAIRETRRKMLTGKK